MEGAVRRLSRGGHFSKMSSTSSANPSAASKPTAIHDHLGSIAST